MGFLEWLSGRNGIYKNQTAITNFYDELDDIKNNTINQARNDCREAIRNLNLVHGMEYVANIGEESFDAIYDEIDSAVEIIRTQVDEKVADIDAFSKASGWEKIGSTLVMTGVKFGEGALSVFESIGDGVVAVGGFVAGVLGDTKGQENAANFIKKNWSHDIFNFYYNSDFAKASAYTENSGAAAIVKLAGQTASYLALGGFVSGLGGVGAKSTNVVVKGLGKFAQSTTRVNTLTATLGGVGQGTETGLNSGLDYKDAFLKKGVKQGLMQGAMAYGFGRLGERAQRNAAVKEAERVAKQQLDDIGDLMTETQQRVTKAAENFNKAQSGAEKMTAATELGRAKADLVTVQQLKNEALVLADNAKNATYQGYTDAITKAGQKAGTNGLKNTVSGALKDLPKKSGQIQGPGLNVVQKSQNLFNKQPGKLIAVERVATAPVKAGGNIIKGMSGAVAQQPTVLGKAVTIGIEAGGTYHGVKNNYENAQATEFITPLESANQDIQEMNSKINETISTFDVGGAQKGTDGLISQGGNSGNSNTSNNNQYYNSGGNSGTSYNPTTPPTTINPVTPNNPVTPVEPVTPTEPVTPPEPTTPTKPTTPENPGTTITNPEPTPTPPVRSDNGGSNSGVDHGGNYDNGTGNIWSGTTDNGEVTEPELPDGELPIEEPTDTELPGTEESVYTIPTDLSGVTTKKKSSSGSSVIPILGGLGAAAAVGVGAKIYMDNKKNNDNGEDDDYTDDFEFKDENNDNGDNLLADEWKEDDNDDTSLNFNDIVNDASEDNNDLGEI